MDIRKKLVELMKVPIYPRLDADPAEVVADYLLDNGVTMQEQGQWTENQQTTYDSIWGEDVYWYTYTCSVCGSEAMNNFDYCPFCGNPMLSTSTEEEQANET